MKLWEKPELKKLCLSQTKEGEGDKNIVLVSSIFPNLNFYYTHAVLPSDIKSDEEMFWIYEKYTEDISLS